MRERTVRISSAGKTFSATGWKIGWALRTPELINEITAVKQFLSYVSGAPFQPAVARALNEGDDWVESAELELQDKRDRLAAGLRSSRTRAGHAARHVLHDHRRRPLGYTDGVEFCRDLPDPCGVVAIPHQVFYDRVEAGQAVRALGLLQAGPGARRGDQHGCDQLADRGTAPEPAARPTASLRRSAACRAAGLGRLLGILVGERAESASSWSTAHRAAPGTGTVAGRLGPRCSAYGSGVAPTRR